MITNSYITATAIAAATILTTLSLTGCTIGETPNSTTVSPEPTTQQTKPPQSLLVLNNPMVYSRPVTNRESVGTLIPPTKGAERLLVIQKGRTDPFGQIVDPRTKISVPTLLPLPTIIKQQPINTTAKSANLSAMEQKATLKTVLASKSAAKPVTKVVAFRPNLSQLKPIEQKPTKKTNLPLAPQPKIAREVVVTGIVSIGEVPQAIIKAPNEPTSRYVQPGQRLMNGVLVKRIEMRQGSNPTVILEEYGIEVVKQVGEKPVEESKPLTKASASNYTVVQKPQENFVRDL
ncbi:hypothetical protein [Dolichospermum circinale]|uniref:hypothetical protein n=1 Tax=Dolichospermum circinale TaxID=109265 RepID=UPI000684A799|nr:hypothetical protein [Dolichospermum circinale]MDB9483409.1 hypothetical protein [Dolichospermum circinale CS-537/05]MDB9455082.1 hypothetical protein [Dolichospermum circinale CS-541/06]MDB9462911.1 hypothetical protein [Dolichospermum circinale CS-541/04]MDB9474037.1 hypothetical protein [Dolichospermum circinale CS-537/11]MDB9477733.1 hypothetical protein [Dolichospermum circinale CS-537/03]